MINVETVNKYLELNKRPKDQGYLIKTHPDTGVIFLHSWTVDIPQPTEQDLENCLPLIEADNLSKQQELAEEETRKKYVKFSDPYYFKWQAGESTEQEWLDKRNAVKNGDI